jgi:hypothetical protein
MGCFRTNDRAVSEGIVGFYSALDQMKAGYFRTNVNAIYYQATMVI